MIELIHAGRPVAAAFLAFATEAAQALRVVLECRPASAATAVLAGLALANAFGFV